MSWSFEKAGKGVDVAAELGKAAEQATQYMQGAEKEFVLESTKSLTELATQYPENIVIASSTGHMNKDGGYAKIEFKAVYKSPA